MFSIQSGPGNSLVPTSSFSPLQFQSFHYEVKRCLDQHNVNSWTLNLINRLIPDHFSVSTSDICGTHLQQQLSNHGVPENCHHFSAETSFRYASYLQEVDSELNNKNIIQYMTAAAVLGNPDAQYWMGKYLVEQGDSALAFIYFNNAEITKPGIASFELGQIYAEGKGVTQDNAKALELFLRAASADHPEALYKLSILHGADTDKAHSYLCQSAAHGEKAPDEALFQYGKWLIEEGKYEEAASYFELANRKGNIEAGYEYAMICLEYLNPEADTVDTLFDKIDMAAKDRYPRALSQLGLIVLTVDYKDLLSLLNLENVCKIPSNLRKAAYMKWYSLMLACYENYGRDIQKDRILSSVINANLTLASFDDPLASLLLGLLYTKGIQCNVQKGFSTSYLIEKSETNAKKFLGFAYTQGLSSNARASQQIAIMAANASADLIDNRKAISVDGIRSLYKEDEVTSAEWRSRAQQITRMLAKKTTSESASSQDKNTISSEELSPKMRKAKESYDEFVKLMQDKSTKVDLLAGLKLLMQAVDAGYQPAIDELYDSSEKSLFLQADVRNAERAASQSNI